MSDIHAPSTEEHRQRHVALHQSFDELAADYLRQHPGEHLRTITLDKLLQWSYLQTIRPDNTEDVTGIRSKLEVDKSSISQFDYGVGRDLIALQRQTEPVSISIRPFDAYCAIGAIQLACRHPHLPDVDRDHSKLAALALQRGLSLTNNLQFVIHLGWEPPFEQKGE